MYYYYYYYFFGNNPENRIGFKKLSLADLGLSTSNQTHIGLLGNVFTFLGDEDVVKQAMLIYDDYCDILTCTFDRIENPDGTFRSPKIRTGSNRNDSVVGKIRDFARFSPTSNWYLVWIGLESEELVFWLIREGSEDFAFVNQFFTKSHQVLTENDAQFQNALSILMKKVNLVSDNIQGELEIASQLESKRNAFKEFDLKKAQEKFEKIGKMGEELIAQYLDKQKSEGNISDYVWVNQSRETGLPYDFLINNNLYVDVKSTDLSFNQEIYFSSAEIDFASDIKKPEKYAVFRVYDLKTELQKLRICEECSRYMLSIQKSIAQFRSQIEREKSKCGVMKMGVKPADCFVNVGSPIDLNIM